MHFVSLWLFIRYSKTSISIDWCMFLTGVNTAVAPVYLSEIAPIRLRGALGVLNQLGIVTGILVGLIFGLKQVHFGNVAFYS